VHKEAKMPEYLSQSPFIYVSSGKDLLTTELFPFFSVLPDSCL